MKRFHFLIPALLFLFSTACQPNEESQSSRAMAQPAAQIGTAVTLEVLDFHTTHRCRTCVTIEKLTRETLDKHFADQQAEGTIIFRLINADLEENLALAERYGAFGTTLILNLEAGSESDYQDITDFAFKRAGNEERFQAELKTMIEEMLVQGGVQG